MRRILRRLSSALSEPAAPIPEDTALPPPSLSSTSPRVQVSASAMSAPRPPLYAYEVPPEDGRCLLLQLPETVLVRIFGRLDRVSLTRSFRLCKSLHALLTTSTDLVLQHMLQTSSLILNPLSRLPDPSDPQHVPSSKHELLMTLRERMARFRTLAPRRVERLEITEPEGTLYEYLEGTLMRSIGGVTAARGGTIGFWDLTRVGEGGEWEDVAEPELDAPQQQQPQLQLQLQLGQEDDADTELVAGDGMDIELEVEGGAGEAMQVTEPEMVGDSDVAHETEERVKRVRTFGFDVAEFAVDPGQDLLVLVEIKPNAPRQYKMLIHLLTLSTFMPHPMARMPVLEWPSTLNRRIIKLGFQICDDGLFILYHNVRGGAHDQLCGWQWTTGRHGVTMRAFPTMSFESFVLLSPSAFVIATIVTHLDPLSEIIEDLNNPDDLFFTHHLHLYAFPPFASILVPNDPAEPFPPPHTAVHVATLDLPRFYVNIGEQIPPPRLLIRTDPPPRHTLPLHPRDRIPPFHPTPESGVMIIEVFCQLPDTDRTPHYVIAVLKSTLAQYLPAPTSPLLFQAFPRPAPVVPWPTLAPHVRLLGPDMEPSNWVCYVYQYRFATIRSHPDGGVAKLRVYDFDPLRARKELYARRDRLSPGDTAASADSNAVSPPAKRRAVSFSLRGLGSSSSAPTHDGASDGVHLVTAETVSRGDRPLSSEVRTGGKMPYIYVERNTTADVVLVDGERIVGVEEHHDPWGDHVRTALEVMEF